MSHCDVKVVKLGGSLLDLPDLNTVMRSWADTQGPGTRLWVVGGGKLIDAMRALDELHGIDQVAVHWQCVRLLGETARIVHGLVPDFGFLQTDEALEHWMESEKAGDDWIVDPNAFYGPDDAGNLPTNWSTTTDSIAAKLAQQIKAELVLLKSANPPFSGDSSSPSDLWQAAGYVDAAFAGASTGIRKIGAVNLRSWADRTR